MAKGWAHDAMTVKNRRTKVEEKKYCGDFWLPPKFSHDFNDFLYFLVLCRKMHLLRDCLLFSSGLCGFLCMLVAYLEHSSRNLVKKDGWESVQVSTVPQSNASAVSAKFPTSAAFKNCFRSSKAGEELEALPPKDRFRPNGGSTSIPSYSFHCLLHLFSFFHSQLQYMSHVWSIRNLLWITELRFMYIVYICLYVYVSFFPMSTSKVYRLPASRTSVAVLQLLQLCHELLSRHQPLTLSLEDLATSTTRYDNPITEYEALGKIGLGYKIFTCIYIYIYTYTYYHKIENTSD